MKPTCPVWYASQPDSEAIGESGVGFFSADSSLPQEASAVAARTNVVTVRDRTARLLLTLRSFFVEGREPSPPRLVCQIDTPVS
jgi:hypothetical protein